jgi:hypothetical protein
MYIMPDMVKIILKYAIIFLVVYLVYRDSTKKNIRYGNAWVVGSLLFPPIAVAYLLYSTLASKKVVLSTKQKVEIEIRKRAVEHKKKIALERQAMETAKREEEEKNNLTLDEIEKVKAERLAAKKKRLLELEEERKYQQEENAKQWGLGSGKMGNTNNNK